jgi:hypothetical protein
MPLRGAGKVMKSLPRGAPETAGRALAPCRALGVPITGLISAVAVAGVSGVLQMA